MWARCIFGGRLVFSNVLTDFPESEGGYSASSVFLHRCAPNFLSRVLVPYAAGKYNEIVPGRRIIRRFFCVHPFYQCFPGQEHFSCRSRCRRGICVTKIGTAKPKLTRLRWISVIRRILVMNECQKYGLQQKLQPVLFLTHRIKCLYNQGKATRPYPPGVPVRPPRSGRLPSPASPYH